MGGGGGMGLLILRGQGILLILETKYEIPVCGCLVFTDQCLPQYS